eukprot:scaffold153984_cov31-Tisochrysis_lutea.AAC.1
MCGSQVRSPRRRCESDGHVARDTQRSDFRTRPLEGGQAAESARWGSPSGSTRLPIGAGLEFPLTFPPTVSPALLAEEVCREGKED